MSIAATIALSFLAGFATAALTAVAAIRHAARKADDERQRQAWSDMAAALRREQYERGLRETHGW